LTKRLSHKTRIRKLIANSKGFSAVIGTVFMVLVMMFLSTSVFLWTLSQNTLYNQELKEKNQVELDRLNERVTASSVNYTGSAGTISVQVELENNGASAVHITTLWVMDATVKKYGFNDTLDLNLKPGNKTYLTGENAVDVNIAGANATDTLNSWFVTTRGNNVPLEKDQSVIVAQLAQGIGSLAMDFSSFKYYEVTGKQLGSPQSGFSIPGDIPIVFSMYLTNLDEHYTKVNLTALSLLWLYPAAGAKTAKFPIAKVVNQTLATFDFQILEFGKPTKLFFGTDKTTAGNVKGTLCAANLLLYGKIGADDYGQNIPFVSVYVQS